MKKIILLFLASLFLMPTLFAQEKGIDLNKLNVRVTGLLHLDGAGYFGGEQKVLSNGVSISDVRLGGSASFGKWDGRVDVAFVDSKVGLKDVTLGYNINSNSQVVAGHFFEPFGLSRLQGVNSKFMAMSSSAQAFTPGRRLGIAYTVWSNKVWFSGGVFGGKNLGPKTNKGDDGYSATGRFLFNPLREDAKIFHIGFAGSYRKPDQDSKNVNFSANAGTNVDESKFVGVEIETIDNEVKLGAELATSFGKFFLQGEYFLDHVKINGDGTTGGNNYKAQGAYGKVGFLILGNNYTYNAKAGVINRPGAKSLELIARFNHINLNDSQGERFIIGGGEQNDISVALNYYLSNNLMFRLNYANVKVNSMDNFNMLQGRIQVIF